MAQDFFPSFRFVFILNYVHVNYFSFLDMLELDSSFLMKGIFFFLAVTIVVPVDIAPGLLPGFGFLPYLRTSTFMAPELPGGLVLESLNKIGRGATRWCKLQEQRLESREDGECRHWICIRECLFMFTWNTLAIINSKGIFMDVTSD